ncbi:MAG: S-methyl-5-thioribose-1-phosphate isomerase, partial [Aquificaceae bacterium]|nr:S-methyl-5-thioribose-1-phosphate isomerase [Aquificaceae bacterium]
IPDKARVLTHCNAGALATAGYGTDLGVLRAAREEGKKLAIYACETRPLLQGARLTAWELLKEGIPHKVITDSTAGFLMRKGLVDCVVVGADRITRDYFVANKIGTYALSVLAKTHRIPFYVVAPSSTFDPNSYGEESISIEERSQEEVKRVKDTPVAPEGSPALHLAFDITPPENITAIISEKGIIWPSRQGG